MLDRTDWNYAKLPRPRRPKRLPEVLSLEEVEAILKAAPNPSPLARIDPLPLSKSGPPKIRAWQ